MFHNVRLQMWDVRCILFSQIFSMNAEQMKQRTKAFAIDTAQFILSLNYTVVNKAYSNQLIRCSSSVAANYRAVRRAKSKADFINKLKIVEEELDESLCFLELLLEFNKDKENIIRNFIERRGRIIAHNCSKHQLSPKSYI
jgi:four helix bundle protein